MRSLTAESDTYRSCQKASTADSSLRIHSAILPSRSSIFVCHAAFAFSKRCTIESDSLFALDAVLDDIQRFTTLKNSSTVYFFCFEKGHQLFLRCCITNCPTGSLTQLVVEFVSKVLKFAIFCGWLLPAEHSAFVDKRSSPLLRHRLRYSRIRLASLLPASRVIPSISASLVYPWYATVNDVCRNKFRKVLRPKARRFRFPVSKLPRLYYLVRLPVYR